MRVLVIVRPKFAIPPEQFPGLVQAFVAWRERYRSVFESFDFFAGSGGGCGIVNVPDEATLSQLMLEYPFGMSSDLQPHLLLDGDKGLAQLQAMAASLAPR